MRQICLMLLAILLFLPVLAFAEGEDDLLWKRSSYEKKVVQIGQRLLEANGIQEKIMFIVDSTDKINAGAIRRPQNMIVVYKGLLNYIESDDELAAVLGHEIIHITNRHSRKSNVKRSIVGLGIATAVAAAIVGLDPEGYTDPMIDGLSQKRRSSGKKFTLGPFEQHYETEADLQGIDLMVKAGYNPLGAERFFQKTAADRSWLDFWEVHPPGTKRVANVRNHIAKRYPQFLMPDLAKDWSSSQPALSGYGFINTPKNSKDKINSESSTSLDKKGLESGTKDIKPEDEHKDSKLFSLDKASINPENVSGYSLSSMLLTMDNDHLKIIRAISKHEYIEEANLEKEHFPEMPKSYLEAVLSDLEARKIIRVIGHEPARMFILSDWAAQELSASKKD